MNVSDVQSNIFSGLIGAVRKDTYSNHMFQFLQLHSCKISCGDTPGAGLHTHRVIVRAPFQDLLYSVSLSASNKRDKRMVCGSVCFSSTCIEGKHDQTYQR